MPLPSWYIPEIVVEFELKKRSCMRALRMMVAANMFLYLVCGVVLRTWNCQILLWNVVFVLVFLVKN